MRAPKTIPCHQCCPPEWRRTPNFTGSYELDAVIHRNGNKDMKDRLAMYAGCANSNGTYGPRSSYNGYNGYSGDE